MKRDYEEHENIAQLFLELLCETKFPLLSCAEFVYSISPIKQDLECQIWRPAYLWFTYGLRGLSFLLVWSKPQEVCLWWDTASILWLRNVHGKNDTWYVFITFSFLKAKISFIVTNKIFTIILLAYLDSLAASIKDSRERPSELPTSPLGLLMCKPIDNVSQESIHAYDTDICVSSQTELEQWELALKFGKQCLNKFWEPVHTVEDVEKQSCKAIKLLTKRYVHNAFLCFL